MLELHCDDLKLKLGLTEINNLLIYSFPLVFCVKWLDRSCASAWYITVTTCCLDEGFSRNMNPTICSAQPHCEQSQSHIHIQWVHPYSCPHFKTNSDLRVSVNRSYQTCSRVVKTKCRFTAKSFLKTIFLVYWFIWITELNFSDHAETQDVWTLPDIQ